MTIANFEMLFVVLAFVIPGFIWYFVQSKFMPRGEFPKHTFILQCIVLTFINYALWSWLVYHMLANPWFEHNIGCAAFFWFVILFLSPMMCGLIFGILSQKDFVRRIFGWLGVETIHPTPTAWDYRFFNINPDFLFIKVELIDGGSIQGLFGGNSFASSTSSDRDLYIERACMIDSEGQWQLVDESDGVWINGSQIRHIEFISTQ